MKLSPRLVGFVRNHYRLCSVGANVLVFGPMLYAMGAIAETTILQRLSLFCTVTAAVLLVASVHAIFNNILITKRLRDLYESMEKADNDNRENR